MMILFIYLQMLSQVVDALSQQRNLNLGLTGVTLMGCVGLDDLRFSFCCHIFHLFNIFAKAAEQGR